MNWSPSRIGRGLMLATAIVTVGPQTLRAQICPGSNLYYLVRDAKGAIISADRKDLQYQAEATKQPGIEWGAQAIDDQQLRSKTVPPEVSRLNGKVALRKMTFCNFQTDLKLSVTLGGQTMNLLFHTPRLDETVSKDFVVESVPFKPGDYEITLDMPADTWVNYYPARLWKKQSQ
jgi:hypothetical protein